jgi:hypothetical protein
MSQVDFETLVALLAEERDPLVLEEIVCLHANDGDTQLLEKMKDDEKRLHAELATMKEKSADAHRWFDVAAAMSLCLRQQRLIERVLTEIEERKSDAGRRR